MREVPLLDCISFEKFVDLFEKSNLQLQFHSDSRGWQRVCYCAVDRETMLLKLGLQRYNITDIIDLYDMYRNATCIFADFYFANYSLKFVSCKDYLLDNANDI